MFNRLPQDNQNQATEGNGASFRAPSISLSKGGGAIRGIGEKFAANPVTGTGSMTVPIATSRSGVGPQLSLSYDPGVGTDPWASAGTCRFPQSTARPTRDYPDSTMPTTRTSSFSRVPRSWCRCGLKPTGSGSVRHCPGARSPAKPTVFSATDPASKACSRALSAGPTGRSWRQLLALDFQGERHHLVRQVRREPDHRSMSSYTNTGQKTPMASMRPKSTSVTRSGGTGYLSKSLPPLEFEYTPPNVDPTVREIDSESLENLPCGLDTSGYQWADLDGEGLSDVLTEKAGSWFYKRNLSPVTTRTERDRDVVIARLAPIERVMQQPSPDAMSNGRQLLDLAGDDQLDLVELDGPTPGFFEGTRHPREPAGDRRPRGRRAAHARYRGGGGAAAPGRVPLTLARKRTSERFRYHWRERLAAYRLPKHVDFLDS